MKAVCTKCKIEKSADDFSKMKSAKNGLNRWCNACRRPRNLVAAIKYRENNRDVCRANDLERNRRNRESVFAAYGGKCDCCGERNRNFFTIDHIYGGGNEHRRQTKRAGSSFYLWLIQNNFPIGYRILCFNCNCAWGLKKVCPHYVEQVLCA